MTSNAWRWITCSTVTSGCARSSASWLRRSNARMRSEEHTSELQSRRDLVCRLLLEKKKKDGGTNLLSADEVGHGRGGLGGGTADMRRCRERRWRGGIVVVTRSAGGRWAGSRVSYDL